MGWDEEVMAEEAMAAAAATAAGSDIESDVDAESTSAHNL
jgi:hypothetical protein